MLSAIEDRLHQSDRLSSADIEIRAATGAQLKGPGQQASLRALLAARARGPNDMVVEGQHDDLILWRPLHQHFPRARRRKQETHRFQELRLPKALHAAGK